MSLDSQYWLITGGSGLVGSALQRELQQNGNKVLAPGSRKLDLRDRSQISCFLADNQAIDGEGLYSRIGYAIHLAAKVGGIKANFFDPMNFYDENIIMNANFLSACSADEEAPVQKVVSMMSTCVYPDAPYVKYPLTEDQLHMGPPHDSNFAYAFAKRMLDVQTRAIRKQHNLSYVTVIPNNIFGENDNFSYRDSHVIPALIRRIWEAKLKGYLCVEIWGDGTALREFTYSRDIAKILMVVAKEYDDDMPLNIGNTEEHTITSVAESIKDILKYDGRLVYNTQALSGQARKPSSNERLLSLTSWTKEDYTPFRVALEQTCKWFTSNYPNVRGCEYLNC